VSPKGLVAAQTAVFDKLSPKNGISAPNQSTIAPASAEPPKETQPNHTTAPASAEPSKETQPKTLAVTATDESFLAEEEVVEEAAVVELSNEDTVSPVSSGESAPPPPPPEPVAQSILEPPSVIPSPLASPTALFLTSAAIINVVPAALPPTSPQKSTRMSPMAPPLPPRVEKRQEKRAGGDAPTKAPPVIPARPNVSRLRSARDSMPTVSPVVTEVSKLNPMVSPVKEQSPSAFTPSSTLSSEVLKMVNELFGPPKGTLEVVDHLAKVFIKEGLERLDDVSILTLDELTKVEGMRPAWARRIYRYVENVNQSVAPRVSDANTVLAKTGGSPSSGPALANRRASHRFLEVPFYFFGRW